MSTRRSILTGLNVTKVLAFWLVMKLGYKLNLTLYANQQKCRQEQKQNRDLNSTEDKSEGLTLTRIGNPLQRLKLTLMTNELSYQCISFFFRFALFVYLFLVICLYQGTRWPGTSSRSIWTFDEYDIMESWLQIRAQIPSFIRFQWLSLWFSKWHMVPQLPKTKPTWKHFVLFLISNIRKNPLVPFQTRSPVMPIQNCFP